MSDRTADVLLGSGDGPTLADLVGLVRRITTALDAAPLTAAMAFAASGVVPPSLDPALPYPTEWTLPFPDWDAA